MRKIILSEMVTVDGLFAGVNGDIGWHQVNDEFFEFANEQLDSVGTLVFGRVTYEGMESYWTSSAALADDPVITEKMNRLDKIVFSKTLEAANWQHTVLIKEDSADAIARLKAQPGGDMVIFGSGDIVSALTERGLIDEYRLFVCPLVLGQGKPTFEGVTRQVNLKLLSTRTLSNGVVVLFYAPAEPSS